ncbi:MAG: HAMP domain-containing protein, partial [Elusimicrobia bacterium]|nr:HAMP domain-containing protein [Elusimicrobiota bacterium]
LPVAGMGLWMLSSRQAVRDNARFLHGQVAMLVADSAERVVERLNRTLGVVQDLDYSRGQEKIETPALRRAAAGDAEVALVSILDAAGVETQRLTDPEVYPTPERVDRSREPALVEARKSGRLTIGAPVVAAGRALVPVVHPLADGRALFMMYSLRQLERRLKGFVQDGRSGVLFVDAAGRPVPGLGSPPPDLAWRLPAEDASERWWDDLPSREGPWVAAAASVPELGWRAVSLQLRREAYAESRAAAARAVALLAALCLLSGGLSFVLSGRLLEPITKLLAAAERVSRGDFSKPVPPLGWGELDALGRTFNQMSEKVKRYQDVQVERVLEEKAKVEALVSNIPEGVMLVSLDGTVAFANVTSARVLGVAAAPAKADVEAIPEVRGIVSTVLGGAVRSDQVYRELRAVDGTLLGVFALRATTVRRSGRDVGVLVLMREVTLERELERLKEEFYHAIVHDLRAPLAVIDGVAYFLKKQGLGEQAAKYIDMSAQASTRLKALVSDILDIAKLESGTMTLALASVAAESLVTAAVVLGRVPGETKGVAVTGEPAPDAGELIADRSLVDRVLMNLLGNALKFTPAGGRVAVGCVSRGGEVEFFVRDTGPGIPADKVDAVFEKFKQLDRDAAARSGYGLGLSICKRIVEAHGGRIWVESKEGEGSRFAFRLPRPGPAAKVVSPRA